MFRHVVMLRWTSEAATAERLAVQAGLATLPGLIPAIRNYEVGIDAGINEGNFDLVIVADFDDVDGYLAYRDDPDHRAVIRDLIEPILAARAAVQHHR
jgi:hypothetical protein